MISVGRALSELKLTCKKLEQKIEGLTVACAVKRTIKEAHENEFLADAKSGMDSIQGLIKRRNALKAAIVQSNAATSVTVGGKEMTVAEAIERKTSIDIEKDFLRKIRETYYSAKVSQEKHNEKVSHDADTAATAALGAATEGDKGAGYTTIVEAYTAKNEAILLAPEGIVNLIETMQDDVDSFESDVDLALSESNTKTEIEV